MESTAAIFMTGATGQLGSFILADLLGFTGRQAHPGPIYCASRPSSSFEQLEMTATFLGLELHILHKHPQVHWICLDLLNHHEAITALPAQDHLWEVIHAAAVIDVNKGTSGANPNVRLTQEVLLLAEALNAQHFTHISSIAVMGNAATLDEETVLEVADFQPNKSKDSLGTYAKSKILSELEVWRAHQEGMNISIIRPGVIVGMGPISASPQELWWRLWHKKLPISTDGRTGIVDVRDVAEIVGRAHRDRVQGPFVAVGSNPEFHDLLSGMRDALGRDQKLRPLNRDPWLPRMRALDSLKYLPVVGRFFGASMRIMLFSRNTYNGESGAALLDKGYRAADQSFQELGSAMHEAFEKA